MLWAVLDITCGISCTAGIRAVHPAFILLPLVFLVVTGRSTWPLEGRMFLACVEWVWRGFLVWFFFVFVVLQTMKYESSSSGLFVSFYYTEDWLADSKLNIYVGMLCLKLKPLNLFEVYILLSFVFFTCPFINHFNLSLNKLESNIVFTVLVNLRLKK